MRIGNDTYEAIKTFQGYTIYKVTRKLQEGKGTKIWFSAGKGDINHLDFLGYSSLERLQKVITKWLLEKPKPKGVMDEKTESGEKVD